MTKKPRDLPLGPDLLAEVAAAIADDQPAEDLRALFARITEDQGAAARRIAELETFEAMHILEASDEELDANSSAIVRARRQAARLDRAAERLAEHLQVDDVITVSTTPQFKAACRRGAEKARVSLSEYGRLALADRLEADGVRQKPTEGEGAS